MITVPKGKRDNASAGMPGVYGASAMNLFKIKLLNIHYAFLAQFQQSSSSAFPWACIYLCFVSVRTVQLKL
jgi:hypothetical protein